MVRGNFLMKTISNRRLIEMNGFKNNDLQFSTRSFKDTL
jgi:hypothetical protein